MLERGAALWINFTNTLINTEISTKFTNLSDNILVVDVSEETLAFFSNSFNLINTQLGFHTAVKTLFDSYKEQNFFKIRDTLNKMCVILNNNGYVNQRDEILEGLKVKLHNMLIDALVKDDKCLYDFYRPLAYVNIPEIRKLYFDIEINDVDFELKNYYHWISKSIKDLELKNKLFTFIILTGYSPYFRKIKTILNNTFPDAQIFCSSNPEYDTVKGLAYFAREYFQNRPFCKV